MKFLQELNESIFRERLEKALKRKDSDIITEEELNKIKIIENGERLVSITDVCKNAEIRMSKPRFEYAGENVLYARETVCKMLRNAEQSLPSNYGLIIFDAFRPIEYQQKRFDERFAKFKKEYPEKTDKEIRDLTYKFIFPPSWDPQTPPPHSTGGAVDLTFSNKGSPLDMGTEYAAYDTARDLIPTNSDLVNREQRENRIFLIKNMLKTGFTNYPGEWWHFMFGDREWAVYEGKPHAVYGRAKLK